MEKKKNFGELILTSIYFAVRMVFSALVAVTLSGYMKRYADEGQSAGSFFTPSPYGIMLRSFYSDIIEVLICGFLFVLTLACYIMVKKRISEGKEINRAFLYFVCWADLICLAFKSIMAAIGVASRMFSMRMMSSVGTATMQVLGIQLGLNSLNGLVCLILAVALAVLLWRMSRSEDE